MPPFPKRLKEEDECYRLSLFVPCDKKTEFQNLYEEVAKEVREENERVSTFLQGVNIEDLKRKILSFWEEIKNPCYGLRPEGKDKVEISLPEITPLFFRWSSFQFPPRLAKGKNKSKHIHF